MPETMLIKLMHPSAILPMKAKEDDACYDAYACLDEPLVVPAMGKATIPLGIAIQLPHKYYQIKVLGRSGLTSKGFDVKTGTVDYGYRGEVKAMVYNFTDEDYTVHHGDRIAQLDVQRVYDLNIVEVTELDESDRGSNGFGSTGVN